MLLQELIDQRGCGCLAVRAGNGDIVLRLRDLVSQLDFRNDWDVPVRELFHQRADIRDPRVLDDQVIVFVKQFIRLLQDRHAPAFQQFLIGKILPVSHNDMVGPKMPQQFDGGHAGFGKAHDQDFLSLELHAFLPFHPSTEQASSQSSI